MSDRFSGVGRGRGRTHPTRTCTCALLTPALLVATAALAAKPTQDIPLLNQPIVAEQSLVAPLPIAAHVEESADVPANDLHGLAASHHAPQESTGLGIPGPAIDPAGNGSAESSAATRAASLLESHGADVAQVIGAMAVVMSLILITRLVMKRASGALAGGGRPSGVVEILARYPVARGQQLILLKLARRVLLVHQNGTAMTTLSEVVEENEVAALLARVEAGSSKKDGAAFKAVFGKFASEHDRAMGGPSGVVDQGEVIDLTRRPGTLRNLFSGRGVSR